MAGVRYKIEEKELLVKIVENAMAAAAEEVARLEALGSMTPDGIPFSDLTISQAKRTVEIIENILKKLRGEFVEALMQVPWVQLDTHEFWKQTSEAMKSPEAALEWLARFRETLLMSADNDNPLPYAESLVIEAQGYIGIKSIARIKGHVKKNSPDMTDEEIDEFCIKKYGKKYSNALEAIKNRKAIIENKNDNKTKSKSLSADATTREDVVNLDGTHTPTKAEARTSAESLPVAKNQKSGYGEFTNVMLTDDEFAKWMASGTDAAELIEELSSYLASSGKRYKSHYATLINWRKRKATESRPQSHGFKTAADRDREEIKKIADYYAKRREDNGKEAV